MRVAYSDEKDYQHISYYAVPGRKEKENRTEIKTRRPFYDYDDPLYFKGIPNYKNPFCAIPSLAPS